jgi:hypothetical protein
MDSNETFLGTARCLLINKTVPMPSIAGADMHKTKVLLELQQWHRERAPLSVCCCSAAACRLLVSISTVSYWNRLLTCATGLNSTADSCKGMTVEMKVEKMHKDTDNFLVTVGASHKHPN